MEQGRMPRGWRLLTAILVAGALPVHAAAAQRHFRTVESMQRHSGKLLSLVQVSPPPRLNIPMRWVLADRRRQLAVHFDAEQTRAVVGLARPADAAAVASAYHVDVVFVDPKLHLMEVAAQADTLDALARGAAWDARLRYVQPFLARHVERLRDDPGLQQVDPVTGLPYEWNFLATHADLGLNLSKGNPTILVGVVDTGVTPGPDLAGKVAETWYDDAVKSADDVDGHGTAVSSIIAAPADDGIGIAGFGGSARIIMYRDLRLNGVSDAAAIRMLVDRGVRVINLSFGGPGLSFPEADALNYAAKAGVLVVAAAGNRGLDSVDYPAAYLQDNGGVQSLGLAVGASAANGNKASFSNFGNHLSLVAPGAFADGDCQHGDYAPLPPVAHMFDGTCGLVFTNPTTGARYAYMRGTSFATPEVAGAAALLWAARPDLKNYEIGKYLEQGTTQAPHGWLYTLGWGVLDVAHSLELETGLSAADSIQMGDINLAQIVHGAGEAVTASVRARWQDGVPLAAPNVACTGAVAGQQLNLTSESYDGEAHCTWTVPTSAENSKLSIQITVKDPWTGVLATQSAERQVKDVIPPEAQAIASEGRWGGTVALKYRVADETGSARAEISVRRDGRVLLRLDSPLGPRDDSTVYSMPWRAPDVRKAARYSFCVRAWDHAGNVSPASCAAVKLR